MEETSLSISSHSVSITEYVFAQENWLKVIKYAIKLTNSIGETVTLRSSKEFKTLRKILLTRWPGCIIPALPVAYSKVILT